MIFFRPHSEEKQSLVIMRESVSFWKDGLRRFRKNKVAMISLVVIVIIMIFSFIVPSFYPYTYEQQIRGAEHLAPMEYSEEELGPRPPASRCSRISWGPISTAGTTPSAS